MVDWNDELVLDVLVKPKETIIDCNTKFSGLTIDVLENAECDLEKVSNLYSKAILFYILFSGPSQAF